MGGWEKRDEKLQEQGIDDIYTAERSDIIRALGNEPVDYVLYAEAQPFIRKEKSSWFSHGIEMTTQVPFKIVDVAGDKYLYSGRLSIKADSTTFIGGIATGVWSWKRWTRPIKESVRLSPSACPKRLPPEKKAAAGQQPVRQPSRRCPWKS